jgi:hypothetical protein
MEDGGLAKQDVHIQHTFYILFSKEFILRMSIFSFLFYLQNPKLFASVSLFLIVVVVMGTKQVDDTLGSSNNLGRRGS